MCVATLRHWFQGTSADKVLRPHWLLKSSWEFFPPKNHKDIFALNQSFHVSESWVHWVCCARDLPGNPFLSGHLMKPQTRLTNAHMSILLPYSKPFPPFPCLWKTKYPQLDIKDHLVMNTAVHPGLPHPSHCPIPTPHYSSSCVLCWTHWRCSEREVSPEATILSGKIHTQAGSKVAHVLSTAWFEITKDWKQPYCPLAEVLLDPMGRILQL